ncbi:ImmA/IrrE family metallo-endopeptidase [Turicibacter sanguinis]|uniref:ImmA/IrrE family metallo-endopeptidase n=1 Tax=Turicibacter sanguinis TaxID=154288 RepID=UPI0018ABC227|nr:ImmA/IrrE family metallo-endopeptidase [Turicibacter sanguinis]
MREYVNKVVKKYKTSDPFELADILNINVVFFPLGDCNGYSTTISREKYICINSTLPKHQIQLTLAHEIGHILLHKHFNTPYIKAHTKLLINKLEIEANTFAIHLLITDEELKEYSGYTLHQLAMIFGYPEEFIELRLK